MERSELTVRSFADLLGSDAPAPGGGSTAALYMNGMHYKSKYIFNLGKYGYDPLPEDNSDGL